MKAPAFQFYPRDYLTDEHVMLMSLEEQGAYIRLLCHQWLEGSIPGDPTTQARLCGVTPRQMRKIWPVLSPKFSEKSEENRLKNPRMEADRRAQDERRSERSESGKRGAASRWHSESHTVANGSANGSAMHQPEATDGSASATASATAREDPPIPPTTGADAPAVAEGGKVNGNGKHLTLHRPRNRVAESRSLPVVLTGLQEFLAEVEQQNRQEFEQEEVRRVVCDLVFAYWAKKLRHEGAKFDPKRDAVISKRIRAGDTVNELLYAIDGARKDPHLMGEHGRKYDGISTLFRDREQVERLAEMGGYRHGAIHPMAERYLHGAATVAVQGVG